MPGGKRSKVKYISIADGKFGGVYLPYHLAEASENDQMFVKAKMTRKVVTWALVHEDARIIMQEDRRTGEIRKILVKQDGETVLRLTDVRLQADDVRDAVKTADGFDTRPFIELFDTVAQKVLGSGDSEYMRASDQDDLVKARGGDDRYFAARGSDKIDMGGGEDTASYAELGRGVKVDLKKGAADKGRGDKDQLKNVEHVAGTDKKDVIRGDGDDNGIAALGGRDVVKGRGGADDISGGRGDDRIAGGGGGDRIDGDEGDDLVKGGGGDDGLFGGEGADRLVGGAGADAFYGGADADVFVLSGAPAPGGPDQVFDYDPLEGDRLKLPGELSDYEAAVVSGATEIRRDGEAVAVLFGVADPDVLDDVLFA